MSEENDKLGIKRSTTKLGKNINAVLPMIEELTKQKVLPLCLIGFEAKDDGKNNVRAFMSTISDDKKFEFVLYEICKNFVQSLKEKYEPTEPT